MVEHGNCTDPASVECSRTIISFLHVDSFKQPLKASTLEARCTTKNLLLEVWKGSFGVRWITGTCSICFTRRRWLRTNRAFGKSPCHIVKHLCAAITVTCYSPGWFVSRFIFHTPSEIGFCVTDWPKWCIIYAKLDRIARSPCIISKHSRIAYTIAEVIGNSMIQLQQV